MVDGGQLQRERIRDAITIDTPSTIFEGRGSMIYLQGKTIFDDGWKQEQTKKTE